MDRKLHWNETKHTGYVNANATLSGEVSESGQLFSRILYNSPYFEPVKNELKDAGKAGMYFQLDECKKKDSDLSWKVSEKTWPIYRASAFVFRGLQVSLKTFSPISADRVDPLFYGQIMNRITLKNTSDTDKTLETGWQWQATEEVTKRETPWFKASDGVYSAMCDRAYIGAAMVDSARLAYCNQKAHIFTLSATKTIPAGQSVTFWMWLGVYDPNCWYATKEGYAEDLSGYGARHLVAFEAGTDDFVKHIPSVGDTELDSYIRWYTSAAVIRCKGAKDGIVTNMGHVELNQRDAFWMSYLHLTLWQELDQSIIRESARYMRENGKIPTTVLPVIEHFCDIDINCYFNLRIARYYHTYRDVNFLSELFPYYVRSMAFLESEDTNGDGMPEQYYGEHMDGFWGDWKDVVGVEGRIHSPHAIFLYLACLKEGAALAEVLGEEAYREKWQMMYEQASETVNRDTDKGGLWHKDHYAERWFDGSIAEEVLIDQFVGLFFDVIPEERKETVVNTILRGENDFGIPETWPYRKRPGFDEPGTYHNGGIWPFMVFGFCTCLYRMGRWEDAERLMRKVGFNGLEKQGDHAPNEYLHGMTGINTGNEIQGWSSNIYMAVCYGAFTWEYENEKTAVITVHLPAERTFDTLYTLPRCFGTVRIRQKNGKLTVSKPKNPAYRVRIKR